MIDLSLLTMLIDTSVIDRLSPDQNDFDPAEPLVPYDDDMPLDAFAFMTRT